MKRDLNKKKYNMSNKKYNMNKKINNIKVISTYKRKTRLLGLSLLFSDIETIRNDDGVHIPVMISLLRNDKDIHSFETVNEYMEFIIKKCKNSIVYFHNFGRFDSTFILNFLASEESTIRNVGVIERNNIIYEVFLKDYNIRFRDSYLLIPLSLEEIGMTFCKTYKKDNFDYSIINTLYEEDKKKLEDLCVNDCKVLREGFITFDRFIQKEFDIKLQEQLTLPSLSFNIFKKHCYNQSDTPITKNPYETDEFIRRSYKGGIAEVYKPFMNRGYCYDVNSLYPSMMLTEKFPVGKGKFVKGEDIDINSFIGFIECKVISDKDLDFLTYRHPEKGLITPKGEWIDVYFHKEIIKAIDLGYKIKFIKGFKYEREERIFEPFVRKLYDIRVNSDSLAKNRIAKLILNSLYGRFGMKIFVESTKFISARQLRDMKKKYSISNIEYLGNELFIISGIKRSINKKDLYKNSIDTETAVQIASAITAYARLFMYTFKNIKGNKCFYTDTDSIFLEKKLPSHFIGKELGQFKLEFQINKAYFIAPKVYYIKRHDGSEKIVTKGLKPDEYDKNKLLETFNNIINNINSSITVKRINIFKRDFKSLNVKKNELTLKITFPFNKRNKIIQDNKWVDTQPLNIKRG